MKIEYEELAAEQASRLSQAENDAAAKIILLQTKIIQYQSLLDEAISNSEYEKCPALRDQIKVLVFCLNNNKNSFHTQLHPQIGARG